GEYKPILDLRPDLDPGLADVVQRSMHVDAAQRFGSARELQDALRGFVDEELPARASLASDAQALGETMAAAASTPVATRAAPTPTGAALPTTGPRRGPLVAGVALAVVGAVAAAVAISVSGTEEIPAGADVPAEASPEPAASGPALD